VTSSWFLSFSEDKVFTKKYFMFSRDTGMKWETWKRTLQRRVACWCPDLFIRSFYVEGKSNSVACLALYDVGNYVSLCFVARRIKPYFRKFYRSQLTFIFYQSKRFLWHLMNFSLIFVQPTNYMNPIPNYRLYSDFLEILVCVCVGGGGGGGFYIFMFCVFFESAS